MDSSSSFHDHKNHLCEGSDQNLQIDDLHKREPSIAPRSQISQHTFSENGRTEDPWFLKLSGWFTEIISLIVAIIVIIIIVVILRFYDGKPFSETPSRSSLNTIITILSMAFSSVVVAAVISGGNTNSSLNVILTLKQLLVSRNGRHMPHHIYLLI